MRKVVHAAVFAMGISAPALAGVLMDHSVVSVLGEPSGGTGPCSSNCTVGGSIYDGGGNGEINSGGKAQGGYKKFTGEPGTFTFTGTLPANGGRFGTGHSVDLNGDTISGNFNTFPGTGHCTGARANLCSTGPK